VVGLGVSGVALAGEHDGHDSHDPGNTDVGIAVALSNQEGAVVLNYAKRNEVRGTWLWSHFRWQIRTFWFGLLWVMICAVFVVATLGIGLLIAWLPLTIVGIWFIYRILRGWLRLVDRQPMYH